MNKRWLRILPALAAIAVLCVLPFNMSKSNISLYTKIFIFAVYGMSYDILKGYTGFLNLGHALFFGGGTYITGILFKTIGVSVPTLFAAIAASAVYASICAYLMGRMSFRSSGMIATMVTLALGEIVRNIAERWRSATGGSDGLPFSVPKFFMDRTNLYFIGLAFLVIMFIVLKRFVNSPTGRVLLAIRENEQRAIFIGFNTLNYKLIAMQVAGISASLCGVLFALVNRYANTDLLAIPQTMHALLYTLLGGEGTLIGPVIGSFVVNLFQTTLLNMKSVSPIFEKWPIFFGSLYVIVILFMPEGVVGAYRKVRDWAMRQKAGWRK